MNYNTENGYIVERRLKPRFKCDYPARILGHDANGNKFEENGRSLNLSRNGVYLVIRGEIPTGAEVSIRLALPTGLLTPQSSNLSVKGTVVRGEPHSGTNYGIAITFQKYRFC
jgi:hypothetical protein